MSTLSCQSSTNPRGTTVYVWSGHGSGSVRDGLDRVRGSRAVASAISMANGGSTPAEFIERAESVVEAHGRKIGMYTYVQAYHPDEFDVTNQWDLDRVRDIAVKLVESLHSADYLVAVHADSAGGHAHAHILVINHDNLTGKSLQRNTSWNHGLRQRNDELMREEGLWVLPEPTEPKPDWELRRESFSPGGFEQILGDKVYAALVDPRSVDRDAFEQVLGEHDVRLAVTQRDGWSYKMRREDSGKLGRKKASGLTPEFTAEGAQQIFNYHEKKEQYNVSYQPSRSSRRTTQNYGDVDVNFTRRRKPTKKSHKVRKEDGKVRQDDGQGSDKEVRETDAVDLTAARVTLNTVIRQRRADDEAQRDRTNALRRGRAIERQRSSEAVRRFHDQTNRRRRSRDDEQDQRATNGSDFELG